MQRKGEKKSWERQFRLTWANLTTNLGNLVKDHVTLEANWKPIKIESWFVWEQVWIISMVHSILEFENEDIPHAKKCHFLHWYCQTQQGWPWNYPDWMLWKTKNRYLHVRKGRSALHKNVFICESLLPWLIWYCCKYIGQAQLKLSHCW